MSRVYDLACILFRIILNDAYLAAYLQPDAGLPKRSSAMTTLDQLKPGEERIITNIKSSPLTIKLLEMGLLPGKTVQFSFRAPLGDPIAVRISGYNLSLRIDEAQLVELA
jgi:ferrous iron transport protein A